jgi:hypothetical protein
LRTLFLGWLLNQGIEALKANNEGNKGKLISIRDEVLKAFAFVIAGGGILAIIKAAIVGLTRSVIGLAARIGGFVVKGLFLRPFQLVIDALKGMMGKIPLIGAKPAAAAAGAGLKGAGAAAEAEAKMGVRAAETGAEVATKGGGKLAGRILPGAQTVLGVGMGINDLSQGKPISAAFDFASAVPGPIGWAGLGFGFGYNLLGSPGEGKPEKPKKTEKNQPTQKPKAATTTKPMQTPMGTPAKPSNAAPSAPPSGGITFPSMGLSSSPLSTTAPKEDTTKNVTPAAVATPAETKPAETKPAETKPAEITPAETKSVPKGMPNVGPAAKPKPNVVVATAPSQNRQSGPAKSSAPATQVPNIPSSNPDNFYALYSQLNYNVVM